MKKLILNPCTLLLMGVGMLVLPSCKQKTEENLKQTTVNTAPPPPVVPMDSENAANEPISYRLVVSFISVGSGIDGNALEKFRSFMGSYPKKVSFEETPWGREGEVDYCIMLKGWSAADQSDFVSKAKASVSGSDLVQFEEYKPCRHK